MYQSTLKHLFLNSIRSEDLTKKTQAFEDGDGEDVVDRKCFDARSVDSISLEDISEAADMYRVGYRQGEGCPEITQARQNAEVELELSRHQNDEAKGAETSGVQSSIAVEASGSQAAEVSQPQFVKTDVQGAQGVESAGPNFEVIVDTSVSHVKGYPNTSQALTTQVQATNVPEYTQANLCADIMSAELNLPDEDYFRANTDPGDESNRPNSATGSSDFLSVASSQREKSRHPSGVSSVCCTDGPSGRSTPEYVFKSNLSDDGSWDGAPKVIANIMCVIPKSAVVKHQTDAAHVDAKPRRTSDADHQRDLGRQTKLDSSSSDTLGHNLDHNLGHNLDPDNMESGDAGKETKEKNEKKTSKLTELTDCSDPLLGYQNTQDESIFHSTNTHKIALKEIKQTKYKTFRKALDGVHLSVSPYHKYSVPFIETDKGSRCAVRKYLPDEIFWSSLFDGEAGQRLSKSKLVDLEVSSKYLNKSNIQMLEPHNLINCNLTEPIWENNIQVSSEMPLVLMLKLNHPFKTNNEQSSISRGYQFMRWRDSVSTIPFPHLEPGTDLCCGLSEAHCLVQDLLASSQVRLLMPSHIIDFYISTNLPTKTMLLLHSAVFILFCYIFFER